MIPTVHQNNSNQKYQNCKIQRQVVELCQISERRDMKTDFGSDSDSDSDFSEIGI
jgi:hypothetical protein